MNNTGKMKAALIDLKDRLAIVHQVFQDLPFNRLLGLTVSHINGDGAGFNFDMNETLVGNIVHGMLHGGVIATVLDATGGLTATASTMTRLAGASKEDIQMKIHKIGTIDLRVDYLRPGKGTHFKSFGSVMRTGNKVSVTRMELMNQDNILIAVGTGTYIVG